MRVPLLKTAVTSLWALQSGGARRRSNEDDSNGDAASSAAPLEIPSPTSRPSIARTSCLLQRLPPLAPGSRRVFLLRHAETDADAAAHGPSRPSTSPPPPPPRGSSSSSPPRPRTSAFISNDDHDLNQMGRSQAQQIRDMLPLSLPFGVVASSSSTHCMQTADVLYGKFRETAVRIVLPPLAEMKYGSYFSSSSSSANPYNAALQRRTGNGDHPPPRHNLADWLAITQTNHDIALPGGGESVADVKFRAHKSLQVLLRDFNSDHLLVIAHDAINRVLLSSLLQQPASAIGPQQHHGCVNVLDVNRDGDWTAHVINYRNHIDELAWN